MNRYDCFELLAPLIKDQMVIGSLSGQRVEWGHLCPYEGNLLVASMGQPWGSASVSRWSCRTVHVKSFKKVFKVFYLL
ncbi:MAG: hypothetical protein HYY81_02965 [Deltaproteobacteria bacterium]|nr:hypothetical protein [Deltaproteobacteria bacterium]